MLLEKSYSFRNPKKGRFSTIAIKNMFHQLRAEHRILVSQKKIKEMVQKSIETNAVSFKLSQSHIFQSLDDAKKMSL